jgi:coenzyme F420-reducing hydrogenase delta subunit
MGKLYTEVLVFACNWDGWSCIETASSLGLYFPASVKVVKVSCLSRVHVGLILKAFEFGADGVMLLGCEQGRCHFGSGSEHVINEFEKARTILEMLGIWKGRLVLAQPPIYDGHQFVAQIMNLMTEIEQIPASKRAGIAGSGLAQDIKVESHL